MAANSRSQGFGYPLRVPALALAILILAGLATWLRLAAPSDATLINRGDFPWGPGGRVVTSVAAEGTRLQAGDEILAVAGRSMPSWARALAPSGDGHAALRVGETPIYQVNRGGHIVDVPVTLRRYRLGATAQREWSALLFVLVMMIVCGFVFVRRPRDIAAQTLLLIGVLAAYAATSWIFGLEVSDVVGRVDAWRYFSGEIGFAFFWAAVLHFFILFPRRLDLVQRHPRLIVMAYAGPFALHGAYLAIALPRASGMLTVVAALGAPVAMTQYAYPVLLFVILVHSLRAVRHDPGTLAQFRWVAWTVGVGMALYLGLWMIPAAIVGSPLLPWNTNALVFLPVPFAFAAAVLRYQVFDIQLVIQRTVVYAVLSACIIGIYVATVGVLGLVLHREGVAISLLGTALVAVLFQPGR